MRAGTWGSGPFQPPCRWNKCCRSPPVAPSRWQRRWRQSRKNVTRCHDLQVAENLFRHLKLPLAELVREDSHGDRVPGEGCKPRDKKNLPSLKSQLLTQGRLENQRQCYDEHGCSHQERACDNSPRAGAMRDKIVRSMNLNIKKRPRRSK